MIQVHIDERCQGHGQCYGLFPQFFSPDEEGFGTVRADAVFEGSDDILRDAVACCPEQAIVVHAGP